MRLGVIAEGKADIAVIKAILKVFTASVNASSFSLPRR